MYAYGKGVDKDPIAAIKWYRLSAEQGYADAQYNLGVSSIDGLGVTQDYQEDTEAEKWMRLSAEQEHERAQFNLDNYA